MAFPTVETTSQGTDTGLTSYDLDLPAGIEAGDVLLAHVAGNSGSWDATWPVGWTELFRFGNGGFDIHELAFRVADGNEGLTVTITTGANTANIAYIILRISGSTGEVEVSGNVTGSSGFPDSENLTPTFGSGDTLWFSLCMRNSGLALGGFPANYDIAQTSQTQTGVTIQLAGDGVAAAAEDPGAWPETGVQWSAVTVAIQGAEAGGGLSIPIAMYHYKRMMGA